VTIMGRESEKTARDKTDEHVKCLYSIAFSGYRQKRQKLLMFEWDMLIKVYCKSLANGL